MLAVLTICLHIRLSLSFSFPTSSISNFHSQSPQTLYQHKIHSQHHHQHQLSSSSLPLDEISEEERQNVFRTLLRDLEIEGVPLLGCEVDAVHTMNAALWTTMSELSINNDAQKSCLIMERIPINALQSFVSDFAILKSQPRLMDHLPELHRLSVSLLGDGIGPALIIETTKRSPAEMEENEERTAIEFSLSEEKCTAALKSFITRIVIGAEACPYTRTADFAAINLKKKGVPPGPVAYRYSGSTDVCSVVGSFWNVVCELLSTPQEDISTTMLSLPGIGVGNDEEAHERFVAVMELIGRNLCLFRGDGAFGLVHFHPAYDRITIHPVDKPAYGHLPPRSWLRAMLKQNGNRDVAEGFTDEELALSDYQRRAPFTAINVLRAQQLDAAAGPRSIVDLDLGGGRLEKASGIQTYSRNAIRMVSLGEDVLQEGVDNEMAMAYF